MKVNIDDVMLAFDAANNDMGTEVFYIRKENIFIYSFMDDYQKYADAADECEDQDDYWVKVPDRYAQNEYGMMEDFIYSLENETAREWLSNAIRGRGAFRRFRGACERFHILDDWYDFTDIVEKHDNGEPLQLVVERDGSEVEVYATPEKGEDGRYIIGVGTQMERSAFKSIVKGPEATWDMTKNMYTVIKQLI